MNKLFLRLHKLLRELFVNISHDPENTHQNVTYKKKSVKKLKNADTSHGEREFLLVNHDYLGPILRSYASDYVYKESDFERSFVLLDPESGINRIFGILNPRDVKIIQEPRFLSADYKFVDLILPFNDTNFLSFNAIVYNYNPQEPLIYFENLISNSFVRLSFNREYYKAEMGDITVGFAVVNSFNEKNVYIFKKDNNIEHIRYDSTGHVVWRFDSYKFGFKVISYGGIHEPIFIPKNWSTENFKSAQQSQGYGPKWIMEESHFEKVDLAKNIFVDDYFCFIYSRRENLVCDIIEEFSKPYPKCKMENEIKNDFSNNIIIFIPRVDILAVYFLYYIRIKKKPVVIDILGISLEDALLSSYDNSKQVMETLCNKYNCSHSDLEKIMENKYGISNTRTNSYVHSESIVNFFNRVVFRYLASVFSYSDCQSFHDSSEYKNLKANFGLTYNKLKKQIYSKSNYRNEVQLYRMISYYFDDAIYQYKPQWLGQLAIDVYIPQLKLAIEYQGEQHYSRSHLQSDFDSFRSYSDRDRKKKELCNSNNIELEYWVHTIPITLIELNRILEKVGAKRVEIENGPVSYDLCLKDRLPN